MKCPICSDEFEPKRSDAKTCGKPACRKKLQRQQLNQTLESKGLPKLVESLPTPPRGGAKKLDPPFKPEFKSPDLSNPNPEPAKTPLFECKYGECLNPNCTFGRKPKAGAAVGKPVPGSPEWLVHGTFDDPGKTWDRVCVRCGEKYTTSLELMRFCSDTCKSEVMVVIANGPHPNYLKFVEKL